MRYSLNNFLTILWMVLLFEAKFLDKSFVTFELNEDGGAKITSCSGKHAHIIFSIVTVSLVEHGKIADSMCGKKVFQNNFGLSTTIRVTFFRNCNLYQVVEMLRNLNCISFPNCAE